MGTMVSARNISIVNAAAGKAYGLEPEVAWNKGITIDQKLKLFGREANVAVDFFRNDFTNQVIVDLENPHEIRFYNLNGKSYSNSLQAELNTTPLKNFDVRLAYRWFDVKQTYKEVLLQKPFTAQHRAFVNLGYEISGWKFDYTMNYIGNKRVPATVNITGHPKFPTKSPDYITMNAQVSKELGKKNNFELYVGGENVTNYMQMHSIIAADQPFSPHFDASMIWGPVSGRLFYAGFRFKIK
jgi:outer membrane receptor protein involved in Fe transport